MLIRCLALLLALGAWGTAASAEGPANSPATEDCLGCHVSAHPGIAEAWRGSRHGSTTPGQAMQVKGLALKVSSRNVPDELRGTTVGCAECHTMRADKHADTFEHNGYQVHVVVSPDDCATCHAVEREEYADNLMARARVNFVNNPLYMDLQRTINGVPILSAGKVEFKPTTPSTLDESCLYCHGTKLEVTGTSTRDTAFGTMDFPVIAGWPNQGVGRTNLDGSDGSCAACHTRHSFSIETARKPSTCKGCHIGPDVPAAKVYEASKHGALYASHSKEWDFKAVPWTVGKDFAAPTCAGCHVSLLVDGDGEVLVERTHRMSERLPWRIFGLVYAHPHPLEPDLTRIVSSDGLPLPTSLDGTFASSFLIGPDEQKKRLAAMQSACRGCHGSSWVEGHFRRFDHTIGETNAMTKVATAILQEIWKEGLAMGPAQGGSPFDEAPERIWMDVWLIHANNIRFASAMAGGGDYGVFADGRYMLSKRVVELSEWLELRRGKGAKTAAKAKK
jgi:hydroxylamine dehydrogenase